MDRSKRDVIRLGMVAIGATLALPGCGGGGDSSTGANTGPVAQKGEVSGNVAENRNSSTGSREGIVVSVGDQSTTTDANGRFSVKDAPGGSQRVTFQAERSKLLLLSGPTFNVELVSGGFIVDVPVDGRVEFLNVRIQDDVVVADQIVTIAEDGSETSESGGSLPPARTPDPDPGQDDGQSTDTAGSSVLF